MPDVRIDPLTQDDVNDPSLVSLWRSVDAEVRQAPGSRAPSNSEPVHDFFIRRRHGVTTLGWVARPAENEICGVATLTLRDSAGLAGVGKFDIRVTAQHRRHGLGTHLTDSDT
jgi:hypothetical protein